MDNDLPQPGSVLRHPGYLHFAASRIFSTLAFQSATVALGWMIYDQTHSAYALGLVGFCQFLPMVVLTFVVGHVADQFDRRRITLACQLLEGLTCLILAFATWQHLISATGILAAVTVLGALVSFERPTMAALLPNVVPTALLPKAIATSTSAMQSALIIGPSLGGLLYGLSPVAPLLASALCFVVASFSVISIKVAKRQKSSGREPVTLASVFAGVAFIRSKPLMLGTISLDLFAVLLGGATALLPIFARDILHAGPWGLGLLRASPAIGALCMSIILARWPIQAEAGKKMLIGVSLFGLATIIFSLSGNVMLSVLALLVAGASDTISVVVRSSLVQLLTPDAMRGRVNAVNSLFIGTSNQLGEFESGMLAGLLGPVTTGVVGGIGTIVVVLLWTRLFPDLPKVKTLSG